MTWRDAAGEWWRSASPILCRVTRTTWAPRVGATDRRLLSAAALAAIVLFLIATVQPLVGAGGLVLLVGGLLVVRRPHWALVGLLFLEPFHIVFYSVAHGRFGIDPGPLTLWKDMLLAALLLRGLGSRLGADGMQVPRWRLDRFVVVYLMILTLIAVSSPDRKLAGYGLTQVAEGPMLYLAIVALEPPPRVLRLTLGAIVAAASIMAVVALIERGPQESLQTWLGFARPTTNSAFYSDANATGYRSGSFLSNPLILGFYLAAAAPLAFVFASRAWRLPVRAAGVLAAALAVSAVYFTGTRSGYLGLAAGALVALGLVPHDRVMRLTGFTLASGALLAFVLLNLAGNTNVLSRTDDQSHATALTRDLDRISANPTGFGLGTIDAVGQRFGIQVAGGASESTYLAKVLEGGVLEGFSYLVLIYALAMTLRSQYVRARRRGDDESAALLAGALGALVAVAVAGILLGQEAPQIDFVVWGGAGAAILLDRGKLASPRPVERAAPVTVYPGGVPPWTPIRPAG